VSTKSISTSIAASICDVCGRTLLRGERAEVYVNGGTRRSVCELCTSRALHGGWVREGTVPEFPDSDARVDRRRSLLHRRRTRRETSPEEPVLDTEYDPVSAPRDPVRAPRDPVRSPRTPRPGRAGRAQTPAPSWPDPPARPGGIREPRHVRAVPTSIEHKISSAIALFNSSEHPRTVAGIARSLGLPEVSVLPVGALPSVVNVVVSWELCWYRYELDLSDEVPSVRAAGQGYELDELGAAERRCNAVADDRGQLSLSA